MTATIAEQVNTLLPGEPAQAEETQTEEFHITNEASANWFLRKLATIEGEQARVKAQYESITKSLNADAVQLKLLYLSEFEQFVRAELAKRGSRCKTLKLLQGNGSLRKLPSYVTIDPDYTGEFPEQFYEVERTLVKGEYINHAEAHLEETGEILPGIVVVPERESFRVTFGKGE